MKNFKKIFALIGISLCAGSVFAQAPQPVACPDVSALQSVPMEVARNLGYNEWGTAVLSNNYGTEVNWTFVVAGIKASSEQQAINKSKNIIPNLHKIFGPEYDEDKDLWFCGYATPKKIPAIAATPPVDLDATLKLSARFTH